MGVFGSRLFRLQLEALKSNDPRLYSLSLEQVPLGDEGARLLAKALQNNKVLRRLCLGHCGVTSLGLQSLVSALCDGRAVQPRLRRLELSTSPAPIPLGNPIGDEGAASISHLLLNCGSLRHLSLGSCNLGDEGARIIAQALASNKTLRTLDLSYNSISDIGAEKLGAVLSCNTTLQGLSLWHNRVFHSGAEALANGVASNTTLKWLGLGCNHVGDEGVKALALALLSNAHDSHLVWLGLGGNEITDRGAEHLAIALKAQHTSNAHLNNDEGETASLAEQIRAGGLRPVLELGVTPSHVSLAAESQEGEGPGSEGDGPHSETGEMPPDNPGIYGDLVYCIPLESLGLGGNQITCSGATVLADGLKSNTRLVSLGLADNVIGNNGAAALAELVRQSDTLESLVLSGNDIGNEGGSMMVAALAQNTSLKALYMAHNPLGDEVSKRCLEVIGHHNHTLQLLDIHNTRMSTPAVYDLVEGMQKEGILRALGSQPLPLHGDGVGKSHDLPATGNILEMQDWKPPSYHTVLLQRQGKRFTSTAPSQRYTTYEALGSLPAPEETAQALVIKEVESEGGATHKRRASLSHFFRRKFSRRKESSVGSYDINLVTPSRKVSKSLFSGHELHTLSETEEEETTEPSVMTYGGTVFKETRLNSQLSDEPLMRSTLVDSNQNHSQSVMERGLHTHDVNIHSAHTRNFPHHPTQSSKFGDPPTLSSDFSGPLTLSERLSNPASLSHSSSIPPVLQDDVSEPSYQNSTSDPLPSSSLAENMLNESRVPPELPQTSRFDDLDAIDSSKQLGSLTKNRVRPPLNRRPPSRQRSSSPSPRHHQDSSPPQSSGAASSVQQAAVTRVGGITGISADSAMVADDPWPELDASAIKLQWRTALQKRVGMLNMGSFLHTGFEAVKKSKLHPPSDVSYGSLPRNGAKNRPDAPLPPAHSRVKLQLVLEEVGSDYINANYVGYPSAPGGQMIVTQAPLRSTTGDFWRMIWEQRTSIVVAITTEEEGRWWPKAQGGQQRHSLVVGRSWAEGCLNVKLVSSESKGHYGVHRLSLESVEEQESDSVVVYHFWEWPRHATPNTGIEGICEMIQEVMRAKSNEQLDTPMVVVSCHGAGRAGCFCAVVVAQCILTSSDSAFIDGWSYDVNLLDMVIRGIRSCRGNLVENERQYEFCHQLLEMVMRGEVKGNETPHISTSAGEKKMSRWRLFQGRNSENKSKHSDKQVSTGKQGKQDNKKKKKASKGVSKQSVVPEAVGDDMLDEDAWEDTVNLMW